MSPSKPSSFVRWSRVSGMSSTIRTRIWSAISSVGPVHLVGRCDGCASAPERRTGAGPEVQRARRVARVVRSRRRAAGGRRYGWWPGPGGRPRRAPGRNREVGGRALEDDARRVAGPAAGTIGLPSASMKSSGERRTRLIEPSSWANLMISACSGVTARITISCWPLSDVVPPSVGVGGAVAVGGGRRRRQRRAEDLQALRSGA